MSTPPPPPPPPPGYGSQPPAYGSPPPGYGGPPAGYGGPPGFGPPGYGQPAGYGYEPPRPHPRAVTSMVLGIVSLVLGFMCGVGFILGPFALVIGRKAVREIDASNGTLGGRGQATAGWICGLVATIFLALGVAFLVLAIVLGAFSNSNTNTIFVR